MSLPDYLQDKKNALINKRKKLFWFEKEKIKEINDQIKDLYQIKRQKKADPNSFYYLKYKK